MIMNLFDLHCDTIGECHKQRKNLFDNDLHLSLCKGEYLDKWCQVFAVWIPDDIRGEDAFAYFKQAHGTFRREMDLNSSVIQHCLTGADIADSLASGKRAGILSVEGGAAAAGSLEKLRQLNGMGVKQITITWNGSNEIGNGCLSEDKSGLTVFGKRFVAEMERLNMVIDVSHLNERGFYDIAETAAGPFVASHSNCTGVFPHQRGLTDGQIKTVIARCGLIGVNFYQKFLCRGKRGVLDAVYRHITHILDLGGRDAVALGSDFDGCALGSELGGIDRLPALWEYLAGRGITAETIDKLFFSNAMRFYQTVLQSETHTV